MTEKHVPDGFPERVADEVSRLVEASVKAARDVVPPRAQRHLITAQRELFMALTTTLEHHAARKRKTQRRAPAQSGKQTGKRPRRVPLD